MDSQGKCDVHGGGGGRNQGHADGPEPLDQPRRHDAALKIGNTFLGEEINFINNLLVDTEINVISDNADAGTLLSMSYMAVAVAPDLKALFGRSEKPPISAAKLLVPADYPRSSPVLVEDHEDGQESNEFKAMSRSVHKEFKRALPELRSINDIAREWDACVHAAVLKLAMYFGGGTFTSRYGNWESVSSLEAKGAAAKGEDHACDRAETTISKKSAGKSEITPADGHSNTRGHACSTPAPFPLQPEAHRINSLSTHSDKQSEIASAHTCSTGSRDTCSTPASLPPMQPQVHRSTGSNSLEKSKQLCISSKLHDLGEELQKIEATYNVIMETVLMNQSYDVSDLWQHIDEGVKKCEGICTEIHALRGFCQEIDPKFIR